MLKEIYNFIFGIIILLLIFLTILALLSNTLVISIHYNNDLYEDYYESENIELEPEPIILNKYIKKVHVSKPRECTICLELGDECFRMKCECKNLYHKDCIQKWLEIKRTCPTCKKTL